MASECPEHTSVLQSINLVYPRGFRLIQVAVSFFLQMICVFLCGNMDENPSKRSMRAYYPDKSGHGAI